MAPGATAVAARGVGGWSPPAGPRFCGFPWSQMCFTKTSGRGMPPDPRTTSARHVIGTEFT